MKEQLFILHPPSPLKRLLERGGFREVAPSDICPSDRLGDLYARYPDLLGDSTAIGPGDDGKCQSWRDYPGWWRDFVRRHQ